jgi:DNA segregation ATPase FtsK/SpoIIIE, S-DNA-T family
LTTTDENTHAHVNGVQVIHPEDLPDYGGVKAEDLPEPGLQAGDVAPGTVAEKPAPAPMPVDPPEDTRTPVERLRERAEAPRKRIVPEWATDLTGWKAAGALARTAAIHWVLYRITHLPADAARNAGYVLAGIWRGMWLWGSFVFDQEAHPLRKSAIAKDDPRSYLLLRRDMWMAVARRTAGSIMAIAVLVPAAALSAWLAPWWLNDSLAMGALVFLAWLGRPAGKPALAPATVKSAAARLTNVMIAEAFGALGIGALTRLMAATPSRSAELFDGPIIRTKVGWQADMTMPLGASSEEVCEKRSLVAANLRRKIGQVWLFERTEIHPGALRLTVLDKAFSETALPSWPLLKARKVSILQPIPFGYTQAVELVKVTLFESNFLAGGLQGAGKTSAILVLVCAAALDPRAILVLIELKGTGDMVGLKRVAHRYVSGPARDEDLKKIIAILREMDHDLDSAADALAAAIRRGDAPDRKVTEQLATDVPELRPRVLVIDEIAEIFQEKEYAAEAERLIKSIMRRGRAFGWVFIIGIQNPDAKSIPLGIVRLIGTRYCLRVDGQPGNDMVLGTSAYRQGQRATLFAPEDVGVGLLKVGTDVKTTRSSYLTTPQILEVGRRAYAGRSAAGTLTGDAVGQELDMDAYAQDRLQVVTDCLAVWHEAGGDSADAKVPGGPSAWLHRLQEELAEEVPGRYGDLKGNWLGEHLRSLGVPTRKTVNRRVDGVQEGRPGVTLAAMRKALEDPDDV